LVNKKVVVNNPTGLHLRPAGLFCRTAMQFDSIITVEKEGKKKHVTANAKSVLSILGACIKSGDEITIVCDGDDEENALVEMVKIVEEGLGE